MAEQEQSKLLPHEYVPANLGHAQVVCKWCHGTQNENAVLGPNHCDARPVNADKALIRDALLDSQYMAGVKAGWNAAQDDNPEVALAAIQSAYSGHLAGYAEAKARLASDKALMPEGLSEEWCLKMARLEDGCEIGAGSPDHPLRAPDKALMPEMAVLRAAVQNAAGFLDTPVMRRRHAADWLYAPTIESIRAALTIPALDKTRSQDRAVEAVACAIYGETNLDGLGEDVANRMRARARDAIAAFKKSEVGHEA